MEGKELLLTRRSVRHYETGKVIPMETLKELIIFGMNAPSAKNKKEWEFVVVQDKTLLHQMKEIHPYASFLEDAGTAIVVCGDTQKEYEPGHWVVDCANATENILLGAHEMGLGGVWCSLYPSQERMTEFAKMLHLPENIKPLSLCVLGYPSRYGKIYRERYEADKIHFNKW
ncbi:MAG: nitroreductase family protein [Alphaproteobacteria bacterium]|nr:nitroreductase family protein [Alphaproteobacteria bacterium]